MSRAPAITSVRAVLALACAATFAESTLFSVIPPLLPFYRDELGLSKSAGTLAGAYALGALLSALPVAFVLSRIGPKRCMLAGFVILCTSSVAFALGTHIVALDAARFFQGIAASALWEASLLWIVSVAPAARRNEMVGTVTGIGVAGTLVGPVLGSAADLDRPPAVLSLRRRDGGRARRLGGAHARRPTQRAPRLRVLLDALRRERRLGAGLWFTLLPACLYGTLAVLAPLRLDALGAGTVAIGATFAVSAGVEAALSPVLGRFCDARGPLLAAHLAGGVDPRRGDHRRGREPVLPAGLVVVAGALFGMSWIAVNAVLAAGALTGRRLALEPLFGWPWWTLRPAGAGDVGGPARELRRGRRRRRADPPLAGRARDAAVSRVLGTDRRAPAGSPRCAGGPQPPTPDAAMHGDRRFGVT